MKRDIKNIYIRDKHIELNTRLNYELIIKIGIY